jgi:hypothetical protein
LHPAVICGFNDIISIQEMEMKYKIVLNIAEEGVSVHWLQQQCRSPKLWFFNPTQFTAERSNR